MEELDQLENDLQLIDTNRFNNIGIGFGLRG